MPVTTSQIPALLLPGVRKLKGQYREMETQWKKIYAIGPSNMEAERTVHVRYLGLPQLKLAGTATQMDNLSGQRFTWQHIHVNFSLGYAFTEEALDDNLYKSAFDAANLGLARSFRQLKEINGAAPLNTGNVLNATSGGDNLPLFSPVHPVDGFLVPNTPITPTGLNEATVAMAANMTRRFRDEAGLLFGCQAKKGVVPVEQRHVAKRIWETELRPGTNNNDVWSIKESDDLRDGYVVLDFLTSPFAWFLLSDAGGLICLDRKPFRTEIQTDFSTNNLMVKGSERYYIGTDDWRLGVGVYSTN